MESTFSQFLARDSMVDFRLTVAVAGKLHKESRAYQNFKKNFTKAWNELADDNNELATLVLEISEKKGIPASEDNVMRFLESLDEPLMKEVPTTRKSRKLPASFALPNSPTGKRKRTHQLEKNSKGWNNVLSEVCELMHKQHAESFRENILSMTDRFGEIEDTKFSVPAGDTGIYAKWGGSGEIREACYEVVTKFGYSRDDLVIKDLRDAIL